MSNQGLIELAVEFYKLEKVELSGVQGKMLSLQVAGLYEAFQDHFKIFTENNYDNLDPTNQVITTQIGVTVS